MRKIPISSFEPGSVSNKEYAVRTLQDGIELHSVKHNAYSIVLNYRDFVITAARLKDDDKWLFTGEKDEIIFTDFNFGEHLELVMVDLNIDKLVSSVELNSFLEELVALIYTKLDNMDEIEIKSVMATVGYCNCAIEFNIPLPKNELADLKELYKGLNDE